MIAFKDGIDGSNVHPAVWTAIGIAYMLRKPYTPLPMTLTAMNAGTTGHMQGSYHYPSATPTKLCQACDIRTEDIPAELRQRWFDSVKPMLSSLGFDVILESPETTGKPPHLHIEYQPHAQGTDWMRPISGYSGNYKQTPATPFQQV